ncbi:hypothetical protein GCM10027568_33900 [Humibacter soli]
MLRDVDPSQRLDIGALREAMVRVLEFRAARRLVEVGMCVEFLPIVNAPGVKNLAARSTGGLAAAPFSPVSLPSPPVPLPGAPPPRNVSKSNNANDPSGVRVI